MVTGDKGARSSLLSRTAPSNMLGLCPSVLPSGSTVLCIAARMIPCNILSWRKARVVGESVMCDLGGMRGWSRQREPQRRYIGVLCVTSVLCA